MAISLFVRWSAHSWDNGVPSEAPLRRQGVWAAPPSAIVCYCTPVFTKTLSTLSFRPCLLFQIQASFLLSHTLHSQFSSKPDPKDRLTQGFHQSKHATNWGLHHPVWIFCEFSLLRNQNRRHPCTRRKLKGVHKQKESYCIRILEAVYSTCLIFHIVKGKPFYLSNKNDRINICSVTNWAFSSVCLDIFDNYESL